MSNLIISQDGPVTIVTINRPERRNAVDAATARELFDAFKTFDGDADTHIAILTGANGRLLRGRGSKGARQRRKRQARRERRTELVWADGAHAPAPLQARNRRDRRPRRRWRRRAGALVRPPGDGRRRDLRHLLPPLRRAVGESRHHPPAAFRRPLARHGPHAHGRAVDATEALAIGLANRVAPQGQALADAIILAKSIAAFPQTCLRNDRLSALEQWDLDEGAAIDNEIERGLNTLRSSETAVGAQRFASGEGRHGDFS